MKERLTLFGAVDYLSGRVIAQSAEKGNSQTFRKYLKKVIRCNKGKKVYLILDNVRYHHAKILKQFLEKHQNEIELIFLPAYSPDLNPMERVWWLMRKRITHNRACITLKERLVKFWKMFSQFQKPNTEILNLCNINFSV